MAFDLCPHWGDSELLVVTLLEMVMLQSITPRVAPALFGLACACLLGLTAHADSLLDGGIEVASSAAAQNLLENPAPAAAAPLLTPAQAAALVRNQLGGQVMSVSSQSVESGVVYGVKLLNGGRMRIIHVDAHTGQLLNP